MSREKPEMTPEQYLAELQREYAAQHEVLMLADYMFTTTRGVNIFDTQNCVKS